MPIIPRASMPACRAPSARLVRRRFEEEGIHAYNSACIHARVSSPVRAARELRPPAWNVGSDVRPVPFVGCVSCEDFDRCPFFSHS
jgi:hypothetical protein